MRERADCQVTMDAHATRGESTRRPPVDPCPDRERKTAEVVLGTIVFLGFLIVFLLKAPGLEFFMTSRDHGYQLSIGTQVLLGKVPGFDVVIAYGPLVMYTSALGLWLTHSLIGETILCSTGYALSVFLIYHLVSRYTSKARGVRRGWVWVSTSGAFLQVVRLAHPSGDPLGLAPLPQLSARSAVAAQVAVGGLILGICWLYRPDFGTTEMVACLAFLGLIEASEPPRNAARVLRALGLFLAGFSVFPLAWFAYLVARVGPYALPDLPGTTVQSTLAVSLGMSQPPPPIRSVIVAYGLIPATYLFAFVTAWHRRRAGRA